MRFAMLWRHVFQIVVCVLSAVQRATRTLHGTATRTRPWTLFCP